MRIVVVWMLTIFLLFTVSIGWYITLPVGMGLGYAAEQMGITTGVASMTLMIVYYITILWGPVWDIFILFWAFSESQRVDQISQTYG